MVSQVCRGGIRKLTNPRINTGEDACTPQAYLLINKQVNTPFHAAPPTTPFAASDAEIIKQLKQQLEVTSQRLRFSELRVQLLEEKLRLQAVRRARRDGCTVAASDHREGPGQRSGDRRCDHQQILESLPALSSERDPAARRRHPHQPRNHRWLGDARRRPTNSSGRGHGPRVSRRHLHPG